MSASASSRSSAGWPLRSLVSLLSPLLPIWDLFTWDNYQVIVAYPVYLRSIGNTIEISIAAGVIGTTLVALVVLVSTRSPFPFARRLEYVAMAPRAVPGIIAGIGILYAAALFAPLGWLRNTIWILVIAYVMRYIPAGFGSIAPSLAQISQISIAARASWARMVATSRSIMLPIIRPALFSCFALIFILCFKEYVTAVFLFAPGSEVIGTTMLQFWQNGDNGPVSALATIQVGLDLPVRLCRAPVLGVRSMADLRVERPGQAVRHGPRGGRRLVHRRRRRVPDAARSVRLRQVDDARRDRRAGPPDRGRIVMGEHVFFDGAARRVRAARSRDVGLVFQSYALWPHMTVTENLDFPLRCARCRAASGQNASPRRWRWSRWRPTARRYPFELSGGQQQRVALARTLVYDPPAPARRAAVQPGREAARAGPHLAARAAARLRVRRST